MLGPFYFPKWTANRICALFVLTMLFGTPILLIVGIYEVSQLRLRGSRFPASALAYFLADHRTRPGRKEIHVRHTYRGCGCRPCGTARGMVPAGSCSSRQDGRRLAAPRLPNEDASAQRSMGSRSCSATKLPGAAIVVRGMDAPGSSSAGLRWHRHGISGLPSSFGPGNRGSDRSR